MSAPARGGATGAPAGPGRDERGFSLIELMVVVALTSILAIGATLALPRGGSGAERAARDLERDAAELARLAMLTGLAHALLPEDGGWSRNRAAATGGWTRLGGSAPGAALGAPVELPADGTGAARPVALEAGGARFLCAPAGPEGLSCRPG